MVGGWMDACMGGWMPGWMVTHLFVALACSMTLMLGAGRQEVGETMSLGLWGGELSRPAENHNFLFPDCGKIFESQRRISKYKD